MPEVCLALGSNLGDRLAHIDGAVSRLSALPGVRNLRRAGIWETPPAGGPAGQGDYLNTACICTAEGEPQAFLAETQRIEREMGRCRAKETVRWGPRIIDIDILLWDDRTAEMTGPGGPELILPHPRMAERAFVLLPLAEIAPDAVHPPTGLSVRELLERIIPDHEGIRRLPL